MDLALIIILIVIVVAVYRDFKMFIYLIGVLEIFFRLIHYIGDKLKLISINPLVDRYIPQSLFAIADKYTNGIIYDFISWIIVIGLIIFLVYLIKYLINRK